MAPALTVGPARRRRPEGVGGLLPSLLTAGGSSPAGDGRRRGLSPARSGRLTYPAWWYAGGRDRSAQSAAGGPLIRFSRRTHGSVLSPTVPPGGDEIGWKSPGDYCVARALRLPSLGTARPVPVLNHRNEPRTVPQGGRWPDDNLDPMKA